MTPLIPLLGLVLAGPPQDPIQKQLPQWAKPGQCGTNSVYVFLRMLRPESGTSRSGFRYEDVAAEIPTEGAGASLEGLATAARKFGADVEVRRVPVKDLRSLPTPYIAHLDLMDRGGTGHFITVYQVADGGYVKFIDGTSGLDTSMTLEKLESQLSGYVLVERRNSPRQRYYLGASAGIVCGIALGLVAARTRRSPTPERPRT